MRISIKRIVSGGQTGVDRAALDVAIDLGIPHGGYVPQGRWAEDGPIAESYAGLVETSSPEPAERTRLNVETSDATLIISSGRLAGGSMLTWQIARKLRTPCLHIDLLKNSDDASVEKILLWLRTQPIERLNVAGPRGSKDPGIYAKTKGILNRVFETLKKDGA